MNTNAILLSSLLLLTWVGPVEGQVKLPAAQVDSELVQALGAGVYSALRPSVGSLPADDPTPWKLTIEDRIHPAWIDFGRKLRLDLNARDIRESDTRRNSIDISRVVFDERDAVITLSITQQHRCKSGDWSGGVGTFEVRSTWLGARWSTGIVRPMVFSDSVPCEPRS